MFFVRKGGFTLVEIMLAISIIGTLFVALYVGVQPYFMRSRDTKRITDISGYIAPLEGYNSVFDTFPSIYGSGAFASQSGNCLSELTARLDVGSLGNQGKFSFFRSTDMLKAPMDLTRAVSLISPCDVKSSYFYSRLDYGTDSQMAILATKLEVKTSSNYGTGADLVSVSKINQIRSLSKGNVPLTAPDGIFLIYRLH